MGLILAIDQGTSSTRSIVFDADGRVLGAAQLEFDQIFPRDGWVEHDPERIWETVVETGRAALAAAGVSASALDGIGITNQRETTLVWDASTGEPLHNAIVWQDRRTAARCDEIRSDGMAAAISSKTGLVVDPYFSSTKLAWLLREIPGLTKRAERGEVCFGTIDSFLIWRLTRGASHATDATNASRTQLFNLDTQQWDEELLRYFGIPRAILPTVLDSVDRFGITAAEWFGAAVPILGVAGDQQAALVGQGCFDAGMTKSTYGTGCFVVTNTGPERITSASGLLSTVGYRIGGRPTFAVEGSIFVAGAAIKWLRDRARLIDSAAASEAAALRAGHDTGGVYVVPAFTGLGAPHWQPAARGLICGLTLDTDVDQIVTATLASVGYQTAELLSALTADGAAVTTLRVDG
ncbi:MAG: glycerol kinase GlpK, partial [Gammaproteobacteria bacterium]|nr:glycerol kinase GlpK [Gammaproteobacteria bacterium]